MTAVRAALWTLAILVVVCAALFVWPTPYRYHVAGDHIFRENRFTSETTVLRAKDGKLAWRQPGD